jgi:hypothetical protein
LMLLMPLMEVDDLSPFLLAQIKIAFSRSPFHVSA